MVVAAGRVLHLTPESTHVCRKGLCKKLLINASNLETTNQLNLNIVVDPEGRAQS